MENKLFLGRVSMKYKQRLLYNLFGILVIAVLMSLTTWKDPPSYRLITTETIDQQEKFQFVSNDTEVMVYAAYFEERQSQIRVIGITRLIPPRLYCLLRYQNNSPRYVKAHVDRIKDNRERRYIAVFLICLLNHEEVPSALTISKGADDMDTSNKLYIKKIPSNSKKRTFTVCLSPLHSLFNDTTRLLEWLEMNIILGVEKFLVYVHSCSREIMNILELYQSKEIVDIIDWPLPTYLCEPVNLADRFLHYCGQRAALNDCLYRTKGYSNYIIGLDIDEYIIPQMDEDKTLIEMLHRLPQSDAYIFRNVFFKNESTSKSLITQSRFIRQRYIFVSHKRSKYIAVTDSVEIMGVHFPIELSGTEYTVNPRFALLHHYRQQPISMNSTDDVKSEIMKKYANKLSENFYQVS